MTPNLDDRGHGVVDSRLAQSEELVAHYEQRRYAEGWALYREHADASPSLPASVHYYGARCARALRNYHGARQALSLAEVAGPTGALLGQIRFTHALIVQEIGEYMTAVTAWERTIQGMHLYPELAPVMEGPAWNNLGLTQRMLKRYDDALDAYRQAAALMEGEGPAEHLRICLLNIAWLHCIRGDVVSASVALEQAEPLIHSSAARWKHQVGVAFLSLVQKDREGALGLCNAVAGAVEALPEDRSHACWLSGKIALEIGQFDMADSLARQAISHGEKARDVNRCLHDAADLLRQVNLARTKQGA